MSGPISVLNKDDGESLVNALKISESAGGALEYLRDIKWYRIDNPKGFKFEFFFDTNPYFKHTVLTKTYHMSDEDETVLDKAIGMDIECYLGKCLTQKLLKEKVKKGSMLTWKLRNKKLKKRPEKGKPITKTKNYEDVVSLTMQVKELQNQMEQLLCTVRATGKGKAPSSSDEPPRISAEIGEAIKQASMIFADGLRDSSTRLVQSIGQEIKETREDQTRRDKENKQKLYADLRKLSLGENDRHRAFNLIGQDDTLMNLFYGIPDYDYLEKTFWLKDFLSNDKKRCLGASSSRATDSGACIFCYTMKMNRSRTVIYYTENNYCGPVTK